MNEIYSLKVASYHASTNFALFKIPEASEPQSKKIHPPKDPVDPNGCGCCMERHPNYAQLRVAT
tara:strand:- start:1727 stop:1918 length:192 start_codon:yes stop_codon:yes gene_type:complete